MVPLYQALKPLLQQSKLCKLVKLSNFNQGSITSSQQTYKEISQIIPSFEASTNYVSQLNYQTFVSR